MPVLSLPLRIHRLLAPYPLKGGVLPPLAMFTSKVYTCLVTSTVVLTRLAQKQLRKVPRHVAVKLQSWVEAVEIQGLEEVRRMPGYHDESLRGERRGQRSIRLSRAY